MPTPTGWTAALRACLPGALAGLLVEQAHLERKAAAAAVRLLFRLPGSARAQRQLAALAREELVHFERALRLLARRGIAFGPQRPSPYAALLADAAARSLPAHGMTAALLDELLLAALIEARSAERMGLVAAVLADSDGEVSAFYGALVAAEERHGPVYLEAAAALAGAAAVAARLPALAAHEAAVLGSEPFAPRLHGGCRGTAAAARLLATGPAAP